MTGGLDSGAGVGRAGSGAKVVRVLVLVDVTPLFLFGLPPNCDDVSQRKS